MNANADGQVEHAYRKYHILPLHQFDSNLHQRFTLLLRSREKKRRSIYFAIKIVFLYLILPPTVKSFKYSASMLTSPMSYSLFYYRGNIFAHHLMIIVEQVILKGNN